MGLPIGALVGGFGFSILKLVIYRLGWSGGEFIEGGGWNGSITSMVVDGLFLSVTYLFLLVFVSPVRPFLDRTCFRKWWGAGLLGMGLTAVVWIGLIVGLRMPVQDAISLGALIGAMIFANGVAGVVLWHVAYRIDRGGS